jgi:hypothetical protein
MRQVFATARPIDIQSRCLTILTPSRHGLRTAGFVSALSEFKASQPAAVVLSNKPPSARAIMA